MRSKGGVPARQVDKFRGLARFVIKHHFGNRTFRLEHQSAGMSNFVFKAKHADGDFVIRISPDTSRINAFIKEHWAAAEARKAGVPAAEILETGFSVIPFPYAISRSVQGVEARFHPERDKIVHEMGRLCSKINGIRTKGFGETFDWSNNKLSHNRTFKDYLQDEYAYESKIEQLDRSRLCPVETIRALRRTLREMLAIHAKPSLNHGDLRLKNVLADPDGKITAIIDWEKATSNFAPPWEFSVALHDLGVDEQQHFIEGYGIKAKRLDEITPFIKAFNLLNYISEIERATGDKDKLALERLRQRFAGVFDLFTM
jgi:aminoglycoside phosphotransferase (APT) family kinase protein